MIERAKELSGLSFLRALILSIGAPPWGPNHLSKVPPLHTITSGIRFQPMNLGGHRYSVCIILYYLTSIRLSITAWRQVMPVLGVQQSGDGGTALGVQWIRLPASTVADTVSIPGGELRSHMPRGSAKKEKGGDGVEMQVHTGLNPCVLVLFAASLRKGSTRAWGWWARLWPTSRPALKSLSLLSVLCNPSHAPPLCREGCHPLQLVVHISVWSPCLLGKSNFCDKDGSPHSQDAFPQWQTSFWHFQVYNCIITALTAPLLYCMLPEVENGHVYYHDVPRTHGIC